MGRAGKGHLRSPRTAMLTPAARNASGAPAALADPVPVQFPRTRADRLERILWAVNRPATARVGGRYWVPLGASPAGFALTREPFGGSESAARPTTAVSPASAISPAQQKAVVPWRLLLSALPGLPTAVRGVGDDATACMVDTSAPIIFGAGHAALPGLPGRPVTCWRPGPVRPRRAALQAAGSSDLSGQAEHGATWRLRRSGIGVYITAEGGSKTGWAGTVALSVPARQTLRGRRLLQC